MRHSLFKKFISYSLILLQFYGLFAPSIALAGRDKYRIEVGTFDGINSAPKTIQNYDGRYISKQECQKADGFYVNVFRVPDVENPQPELLRSFEILKLIQDEKTEYSHKVTPKGDPIKFFFLKNGKLNFYTPALYNGLLEVVSPFSVTVRQSTQSLYQFNSPLCQSGTVRKQSPWKAVAFDNSNNKGSISIGETDDWSLVNLRSLHRLKILNKFTADEVQISSHGVSFLGDVLARKKLAIDVYSFRNKHGSTIAGARGTRLKIKGTEGNRIFENTGVIGSKKTTTLELRHDASVGTIRGGKVNIIFKGESLSNGIISGDQSVAISGGLPITLKGVDIQSKRLDLKVPGFQLDTQTRLELIRLFIDPNTTKFFKHPIATKGRLEIWQSDIKTAEQASEILSRRKEKIEEINSEGPLIEILSHIKAEGGVGIYAPSHKLHISERSSIDATGGPFHAFVRALDLEDGCIVLKDNPAVIQSPGGIRMGRLVRTMGEGAFAELYDPVTIPPCQGWLDRSRQARVILMSYSYASSMQYKFQWGDEFSDLTIAGDSVKIPIYRSNGAALYAKNSKVIFQGAMQHSGLLECGEFELKSSLDSVLRSGVVRASGGMNVNGGGDLILKRTYGALYKASPQLFSYSPTSISVICSPPAKICVDGDLVTCNSKIINIASAIYAGNTSKSDIEDVIFYSDLLTEQNPNDRRAAEALAFPPSNNTFPGCNYAVLNEGDYFRSNSAGRGVVFPKTFRKAHEFKPTTSSSTTEVIAPASNSLIGTITAPNIIIRIPRGGLVLGTPDIDIPRRKQRNISLAQGVFNAHMTVIPPLKKTLPGQISFGIQERFFFKSDAAQRFYHKIINNVVVMRPDGSFAKPQAGLLFSLSPNLLVQKVREACMKTLNRHYIEFEDDHKRNKVDASTVQQLHRNMTDHLRHHSSLKVDPKKAVIYYLALKNGAGFTELSPQILFPQHVVDKANGTSKDLLIAQFLGIIPEGMTLKQALLPWKEHLPEKYAQLMGLRTGGNSNAIIPAQSSDVTMYADIRAEIAAIKADNLILHNRSLGDKLLFWASGSIYAAPRVAEVYYGGRDSYYRNQSIAHQTSATASSILAMVAEGNILLKGVKTHGGKISHMQAGHQIYSGPMPLYGSQNYNDGDTNVQRNWTTQHRSIHHGGELRFLSGENRLRSSEIIGRKGVFAGRTNVTPAYNTYKINAITTEKGASWIGKNYCNITRSTSFKATPVPTLFKLQETLLFDATCSPADRIVDLTHVNLSAKEGTRVQADEFYLRVAANLSSSARIETGSNFFRQWSEVSWSKSTRHNPNIIEGPLEITAPKIYIEYPNNTPINQRLITCNGDLTRVPIYDSYESYYDFQSSWSQELITVSSLVVAAALSWTGIGAYIATAGLGFTSGGVAALAFQAGFNQLVAQVAVGMLQNDGDLGATLEGLCSAQSIRSLATTMATAGIAQKLGGTVGLKPLAATNEINFMEKAGRIASHNVLQSAVSYPVQTLLNNGHWGRNGMDTLRSLGINTAAAISASGVGRVTHGNPILEYGAIPVHAIIGGLGAKALNQDPWAGAIGAATGELTANLQHDFVLGSGDYSTLVSRRQIAIDNARLAAGLVGLAAGRPVSTAAHFGGVSASYNSMDMSFLMREHQAKARKEMERMLDAYNPEYMQTLYNPQTGDFYNDTRVSEFRPRPISEIIRDPIFAAGRGLKTGFIDMAHSMFAMAMHPIDNFFVPLCTLGFDLGNSFIGMNYEHDISPEQFVSPHTIPLNDTWYYRKIRKRDFLWSPYYEQSESRMGILGDLAWQKYEDFLQADRLGKIESVFELLGTFSLGPIAKGIGATSNYIKYGVPNPRIHTSMSPYDRFIPPYPTIAPQKMQRDLIGSYRGYDTLYPHRYIYIITEDNKIHITKARLPDKFINSSPYLKSLIEKDITNPSAGHAQLARGRNVLLAGEAKYTSFVEGVRISDESKIVLNNMSGCFKPNAANLDKIATNAIRKAGLDPSNFAFDFCFIPNDNRFLRNHIRDCSLEAGLLKSTYANYDQLLNQEERRNQTYSPEEWLRKALSMQGDML